MDRLSLPFFLFLFTASLIGSAALLKYLIPALRKGAAQPIYEEGPSWHLSKSGTPTMGGISFFIITLLCTPFALEYLYKTKGYTAFISLLLTVSYALINSLIGIADDILKLKRKKNGGLTPPQKIVLQTCSAALLLLGRYLLIGAETRIIIGDFSFELGNWYYPLTVLILVGITNCANLTDGVDGLASSVAFAISVAMFFISFTSENEVAAISALTIGLTVGFLLFNLNPARIFMGDTGSLFLGAILSAASVALGNPFIIILLGIVYVIEGASVIAQVLCYKISKKRLFKMAPLHHHLEKNGWNENKICITAIILTLLISLAVIALIN